MKEELAPEITISVAIVATLVILLIFFMVVKLLESAYMLGFKKPLFVHFYPILKKMAPYAVYILDSEFRFYRDLDARHQAYFQHRVNGFIKRYKFAAREGLEITNEMKIKVAATWVMLTFGLRNYLTDMFEVIVLYPDVYTTATSDDYRYAEYNPGAKAVVFSWRHFEAGLDFKANNVNLGLHEFAHVVHTGAKQERFGAAGALYVDTFDKIMAYANAPGAMQHMVDANYFRPYAFTNPHDFIAVVLEYYFEIPEEFREKLPELYVMVGTLINYKIHSLQSQSQLSVAKLAEHKD